MNVPDGKRKGNERSRWVPSRGRTSGDPDWGYRRVSGDNRLTVSWGTWRETTLHGYAAKKQGKDERRYPRQTKKTTSYINILLNVKFARTSRSFG
eukprot:414926-Amorphochlora_amoeboformis.AAC.1